MEKQKPVISAVVFGLIFITLCCLPGYEIPFTVHLCCCAAIFVGELIGCIIGNKKDKPFAPNMGVLIAGVILLLPVVICLFNDIANPDGMFRWLSSALALVTFGAVFAAAEIINLINFICKKQKLKKSGSGNITEKKEWQKRLDFKSLIPWCTAAAVLLLFRAIVLNYIHTSWVEFIMFFINTAIVLLVAQLAGIIINRLLKINFVNFALMTISAAFGAESTLRYLRFLARDTTMNAHYIKEQTVFSYVCLAIYGILFVAAASLTVAAIVRSYRNRQKKGA